MRISQLSIENGAFSYDDRLSGQKVEASDIGFTLALPSLDQPLDIAGAMVLNKEKVTLKVKIDTPMGLMQGPKATASLALDSKHVKASYGGAVQTKPVAGLDGDFALDVASVGRLMAWLDRPLAKGQPDPGPLKVRAKFAGDGAKVALKEASIEGKKLSAKASGSFDGSGAVKKVSLTVESGVLDIDRYLPPPAPEGKATASKPAAGKRGNPLEALSDEPIDLSGLKGAQADIKVAIKGIKVAGFRVGPVDFTAKLKDGVLEKELTRLALYGGNVTGRVKLDGSGDALGLETAMNVAKVKVDRLAKAATGEASVVGVASAELAAETRGKSPRALVQNLKGKLDFNLGDVKGTPGGAITEVALGLDLPGLKAAPKLAGHVVFNKEKVAFAATVDPLQQALQSDRFDADLKVTSKPVSLSYAGAVQHRPAPGLDGSFELDVPSVAKLASWLGQPLAKGQPDPGPLKVAAVMAADGETLALKQATITGKAMEAKASGTFKATQPVANFDAKVDVLKADIDAYLPPEAKKPAAAPAGAAGPSDWSDEPYDFAGLKAADGKAVMTLAQVTYKGLAIDKGRITLTMDGGVVRTQVEDLSLAGGSIDSDATIDASGKVAKLNYKTSVKGAQARPLLTAFAGSDRLSGTANIEAEGATQGISQRDMVQALNGKGSIQFLDGAIHGINIAAMLRKAQSLGLSSDAGDAQKTDFAELGGSYVIKNGVVDNRDFKMLAPLLRIGGAGLVPMPPRTVDYGVEAKLVASLQGQGGKDALAGIPIPIKVTGSWDAPAYEVDWDSVFTSIAADPARLANLPGGLADKAKDLGIALPGVGKAGDLIKDVTGGVAGAGKGAAGKAGDLIKGLTGGTKTGGSDDKGGAGKASDLIKGLTGGGKADAAKPEAPKQAEPEKKKPKDLIKGLFK